MLNSNSLVYLIVLILLIIQYNSGLSLLSTIKVNDSISISYGNELEQFYKYITISNENLNKSNLNETILYEKFHFCEKNTIPELGFRHYNCRHDIRKEMIESIIPLLDHNNNRDPIVNKRYAVDCKYNILIPEDLSFENSKSTDLFQFIITQNNCQRQFNYSQGGSTFEITARTTSFITVCRSFDKFDNTYKIFCDLPEEKLLTDDETKKHNTCLLIDIYLHFEHFDAFSDAGDFHWSSLKHHVTSSCICSNGTMYNEDDEACKYSHKYYNGQQSWIRPNIYFTNDTIIPSSTNAAEHFSILYKGNIHHHFKATSYPNSNDYAWRAGIPKYLTVSAMNKCLLTQDIHFIGESHMRYQFDITMDRYVDKLRVGRYHGDMSIGNIYFTDMTFSARMVSFIEHIDCRVKPITYVFQTGSWDLQVLLL